MNAQNAQHIQPATDNAQDYAQGSQTLTSSMYTAQAPEYGAEVHSSVASVHTIIYGAQSTAHGAARHANVPSSVSTTTVVRAAARLKTSAAIRSDILQLRSNAYCQSTCKARMQLLRTLLGSEADGSSAAPGARVVATPVMVESLASHHSSPA